MPKLNKKSKIGEKLEKFSPEQPVTEHSDAQESSSEHFPVENSDNSDSEPSPTINEELKIKEINEEQQSEDEVYKF
jgi:hypothetical protein